MGMYKSTNIFTWDELLKEYASCYLKVENLFPAGKQKEQSKEKSKKW